MMVSLVRWRTERNMLQVAHMTTDVHVSRGHYKVMDTLVLRQFVSLKVIEVGYSFTTLF